MDSEDERPARLAEPDPRAAAGSAEAADDCVGRQPEPARERTEARKGSLPARAAVLPEEDKRA